ncbi:MAG: glycogen/starch synthase [Nitrospirota bacterium]|nr:glycogen/starch synthase [Nitrospirota bacterium]
MKWKRDWTLMSVFFSGREIALITDRLKNMQIDNVVLCSFENRFARSGGLATVMLNILPYIKEVNKVPEVLLVTPFYPAFISRDQVKPTGIKFNVIYNTRTVAVEIYRYTLKYTHPAKGSVTEYYLKAEGFFSSGKKIRDPYLYIENDVNGNNAAINDNALFFSKAVPQAMKALGITKDILFHLHEWQTALISLTAKQAMLDKTLESCATVQTMHNSFDSAIPRPHLARLTARPGRPRTTGIPAWGMTAYQTGLQLTDGPVTTVSDNFAKEFTTDTLQTEHFAPHLQSIFRTSGVHGVNNGMFSAFSPKFPRREKHTLKEVREIKLKNRRALLNVLSRYRPAERFGELTYKGGTIRYLPDDIPVVAMSGRLDTSQKGFDILLRAIEKFAEDEIKVVLTPMPVKRDDLDYFYEVACKCRGNLTVFSAKMQKGYSELQAGATFGIMPSIYEPFGAAVEYMAGGTVVIARATGGLIDQLDSSCGFLYRESAVFYTPGNIEAYIRSGNIMQARKANPLAQNMADNLYEVLKKAADLYKNKPDRYYEMIQNGFKKAAGFSWESSAREYYQAYEMVRKG